MGIVGLILIFLSVIFFLAFYDKPQSKFFNGFGLFLLGFGFCALVLTILNGFNNTAGIYQKNYLESLGVFVAIATAIGALAISIWQGFESRDANRKTVLPNVSIHWNGLYHERPGIHLCNYGIGPAIIKDIKIFYQGKPIVGDSNSERLKNFFNLCIAHPSSSIKGTIIGNNRVLKIDGDIELFGFNKSTVDKETLLKSKKIIYESVWELIYTDIYGRKFKSIHHYFD